MFHATIIFGLSTIAAGITLAYVNKLINGSQPRKVRSEVRVDSRRIIRK